MVRRLTLPLLIMAASPSAQAGEPVFFTNEEQVYFDREAGRHVPPWVGMVVSPTASAQDGLPDTVRFVDAFGAPVPPPLHVGEVTRLISAQADHDRLLLTISGDQIELRRARPVSCWVAIRKNVPQADGSEEEKRKIAAREESLKQQGLDRQRAQQVLQAWREAAGGGDGKEVTPEDLRKVRWQVAGGRRQRRIIEGSVFGSMREHGCSRSGCS